MSGRYVIVQMDNDEGVPLNLREVMAFGEKGETLTGEVLCWGHKKLQGAFINQISFPYPPLAFYKYGVFFNIRTNIIYAFVIGEWGF